MEHGNKGPLLGCTPQACKPCSCPALRLKKEPRDSNRDISGLMDRGSYTSETKGSWSNIPPQQGGHGSNLCYSREEEVTIYGGN